MRADYSGLIPPVRQYRYASLPKGIEDSDLNRMLQGIDTKTAIGARDYAMILLMMAYGLRGLSVAHLLLDDIDWRHSRMPPRDKHISRKGDPFWCGMRWTDRLTSE